MHAYGVYYVLWVNHKKITKSAVSGEGVIGVPCG